MPLRLISLAAALCLTSCVARADAKDYRPKGAERASYDARILSVRGSAQVFIAGKPFAAQPSFVLAKGDELKVPSGGFLVIELIRSRYVITVDEELTLAVADIALLDAPPASRSVEAQLNALLERGDLKHGERVAGYQQRRQAFEAIGENEEVKAKEMHKKSLGAPRPAADDDLASRGAAPASTKAEKPSALEPRVAGSSHGSPPAPEAQPAFAPTPAPTLAATESAAPPWVWSVRSGDGWQRSSKPLPTVLADKLKGARSCVLRLGPASLKAEQIRLKLFNGRVTRVALASGLVPPDCLELGGTEVALPDGWIAIEVPLR